MKEKVLVCEAKQSVDRRCTFLKTKNFMIMITAIVLHHSALQEYHHAPLHIC